MTYIKYNLNEANDFINNLFRGQTFVYKTQPPYSVTLPVKVILKFSPNLKSGKLAGLK